MATIEFCESPAERNLERGVAQARGAPDELWRRRQFVRFEDRLSLDDLQIRMKGVKDKRECYVVADVPQRTIG